MSSSILDKFDLTDQVAIITGGAGMLGKQYAKTLLAVGCNIIVADLNLETVDEAANELNTLESTSPNATALGIVLDVRDPESITSMVEKTLDKWNRIDILINNAAIDPKLDADKRDEQANTFEDYPLELWKQSVDTNLTGPFLCCQAVGKVMLKQKSGVIVNINSTYGVVAPDQRLYQRDDEEEQTVFKPASYAVTKAGLAHLTKYLATYWGDKGIRVNTLTPHGIYTSQDEQFVRRYNDRTPLGRMANQDEMNMAMLYLVSDASSYTTGSNLIVDGGWTAW